MWLWLTASCEWYWWAIAIPYMALFSILPSHLSISKVKKFKTKLYSFSNSLCFHAKKDNQKGVFLFRYSVNQPVLDIQTGHHNKFWSSLHTRVWQETSLEQMDLLLVQYMPKSGIQFAPLSPIKLKKSTWILVELYEYSSVNFNHRCMDECWSKPEIIT